jgi:hypothetical protein
MVALLVAHESVLAAALVPPGFASLVGGDDGAVAALLGADAVRGLALSKDEGCACVWGRERGEDLGIAASGRFSCGGQLPDAHPITHLADVAGARRVRRLRATEAPLGDVVAAVVPDVERLAEAHTLRLGPLGVGIGEGAGERKGIGRRALTGHELEDDLHLAAGPQGRPQVPRNQTVFHDGRSRLGARAVRADCHAIREGHREDGVEERRLAPGNGLGRDVLELARTLAVVVDEGGRVAGCVFVGCRGSGGHDAGGR